VKRGVFLAIWAAALLTGALLAWNAVRDEREFRRLLALGDQELGAGDTLSAIDAFSGAVALKNDSMVAYLKRGDGYRRRGEFAASLRDLREAARLDETAPQPAELLGDVNMAMGRHDRAAEEYRRFVELDDREPRVLYKLALALYQSGDADGAVDPLKRALAMDDRLAEGHYLLGVCLAAAGQRPAAVR
jgi:tetratricopeptide (TPR) repeat protein